MNEVTMEEVEEATKIHAEARTVLVDLVKRIRKRQDAIRKEFDARLKAAIMDTLTAKKDLEILLDDGRELFQKPKTREFFGIRVGLRKGKGGLVIDDEDKLMDRIKKLLPEKKDDLIRSKESPDKTALEKLDAKTLKRLGVEIKDASDEIFIKSVDTEVEKAIKALMDDPELQDAA